MSLWDALRMNMMISYQELVRTFPYSPCERNDNKENENYTHSLCIINPDCRWIYQKPTSFIHAPPSSNQIRIEAIETIKLTPHHCPVVL